MKPLAVKLVSMPFAALDAPSLGLTQLAGVLRRRFGPLLAVEVHYAAFDFARHLGDPALYRHAVSPAGFLTHFGDWFFARAAFPDAPDRTAAYLERYYPATDAESRQIRRLVERHRPAVGFFLDQVIDDHRLLEADVAGFTSMFLQNTASFALARRLKERRPDLITVLGGPACEGVTGRELARRIPAIDYVFSGPALVSFPAFIGRLLEGGTGAMQPINGVFAKAGDEPAAALTGDEAPMDDPVPLAYDGFLRAHEETFGKQGPLPYLLFETSRGCWWAEQGGCTFCGLNGLLPCHRAMTPSAAIRQIQSLYPYAQRARCFVATDNLLPRHYPEQVFARLRPPPAFRMKYETRPDLGFEQLQQLHRAGVIAVQPGIESLSTATLRRMHKGTTAFQNLRFLKACARLPLVVEWNLLLGTPGEPAAAWEKLLREIPLLHHLPPPQAAFPVMVVRHSRYRDEPAAFGLALEPQEFYAHIYPFEPASLERIAAFFVNRAPEPEPLEPWLERINSAIATWQSRWSGPPGGKPARLRLSEGPEGAAIVDSRSGELLSYAIGEDARQVLERFESPKSLAALSRELEGSGIDPEPAWDWLRQRGLLFEEDGQCLSLVTGAIG